MRFYAVKLLFLQFQTAYEEKLQEINKWKADLDKDGLFARVEELFGKIEELENSGTTTQVGAFTKTSSETVKFNNTVVTLDIGFEPKCFEIFGVGDSTGVNLRWDENNGCTGNEGPLYDYDVDLSNNTITISTHTTMECDFIWRAFG